MSRRVRRAVLGLAAAILTGVAVAAATVAPPTHKAADHPSPAMALTDLPAAPASVDCPADQLLEGPDRFHVSQDVNGYLSGCFRVQAMQPGGYTAGLASWLSKGGAAPSQNRAVDLNVSPASGEAGTVITITGYLQGGPSTETAANNESLNHAMVCVGCPGLVEFVDVTWSSAGYFAIQARIPAVPWLGTAGPVPLKPGPLQVGIQCLGPPEKYESGCGGRVQGTATFTVSGPTPAVCLSGKPCAWLRLSPASAMPGALVRVSGWAPLTEEIGTPVGYDLQLRQGLGNDGPSPLAKAPGASVVLLAPTSFTALAGPDWASLGQIRSTNIQLSGDAPLATDPSNSQHLAFCAAHGIRMTWNGGRTWSSISLQSAVRVVNGMGFAPLPMDGGLPSCASVTIDPHHPASLFVRFAVAKINEGIPPIYEIGLISPDSGTTWRPVPIPSGLAAERFGGYRYENAVKAYFVATVPGFTTPPGGLVVEQTTDGGRTWVLSSPSCPVTDPCVALAGVWDNNCAKFGAPELIEFSPDNGKTWSFPDWPRSLDACDSDELVADTAHRVLAVSGREEFHIRISRDGGKNWSAVVLPSLASDSTWQMFNDLQLLPDGSLLALHDTTWMLLQPAGTSWCNVSGPLASANVWGRTQIIGDHLWWISSDATPRNVAISAIHC